MNKKNLKSDYEYAINEYIDYFCKTNKTSLEYWIGDDIGGIANIQDILLNFHDIKYCVDNNISFDWLQHWYYYNYDNFTEQIPKNINLTTYCSLRKNQDLTDDSFTLMLDNFLTIGRELKKESKK